MRWAGMYEIWLKQKMHPEFSLKKLPRAETFSETKACIPLLFRRAESMKIKYSKKVTWPYVQQ
jgi:hypothetical protein